MKKFPLTLLGAMILCLCTYGQHSIYTKEGREILNRKQLVYMCLNTLKKSKADTTALAICECQADKINRRFTNKQYKKHTNGGFIDLNALIKEDSVVENEIKACFTRSGKTILLQAESDEDKYMSHCIERVTKATEKTLDSSRVVRFCNCRLQMIKTKKLSDAELEELDNPNSILFYEIVYKCGDPFAIDGPIQRNWSASSRADVKGPATDTINVLTLNGMTYVKVKIGNSVQVWLFDSGAADMLINTEMETDLRNQNIINEANYLGSQEYEFANGDVDSCRRYRINGVQIGGFTVDNVVVAVTDKGKRILLGKSLLNKFSRWVLDNKENKLILSN